MRILMLLSFIFIVFSCDKETDEKIVTKYLTPGALGVVAENTPPAEYQKVTAEFGQLSVQEGSYTGGSAITPWSSWWFPTKDKYLFENSNHRMLAPLQKYDQYVFKTDRGTPDSALFEEMEIYNPSEVNWAGLCHAWAVASVLHPEPKNEIERENISFTIADQKALLLKSYENVDNLKYYGSRYNGGFDDKFDDVYPDQFHRFVQVFIFEKKLPFLMDYDPSYPAWTVPVYNVTFKIVKEDSNTAHVKAWVTTASSFVDSPDFVGTKKSVKYYEYKLYGTWNGSILDVTGSKWVNEAIFDHPDFLIAFPENAKRGSLNKNLDIAIIDEIQRKI